MPRGRLITLSLVLLPALLLAAAWLGCQKAAPPTAEPPPPPPWFVDASDEVGLNFTHEAGPLPTDRYFMPQIMGSGVAFLDFDNDGLLDVYLIQNAGPGSGATNKLLRQTEGGKFVDVSAGSGLDVAGYGMGVAVGDINNDGLVDVLLTEYGSTRLFLNLGGGKFKDISKEAGIDNPVWGTSAAFFDYDRDGWLDLVIINYVDFNRAKWCGSRDGKQDYCHPNVFGPLAPRLYHNLGKPKGDGQTVRFEDVTVASGLAAIPGPGLGVVCADFNGDHWPDIFLANDNQANRLWINQKNGTFTEEALLRGVALNALGQAPGNMGVALGDVDGDGRFDLFVTHLSDELNTLWVQYKPGGFRDGTGQAGLTASRWRATGFGTILADFDHDGWLDLAVVNGRVARDMVGARDRTGPFWSQYTERNQLFANDGTGRFRDISHENDPFCGTANVARGLAWGDYNNDGAIDLLVTTIAGRARLYRNAVPNRGHWLSVRAIDPTCGGRDAYGAEVTVRAGTRSWLSMVNPGQSYLSSGDPRVHFGLGSAEKVDSIHVVWPDGTEETFPGRAVDQRIVLRKGESGTVKRPAP
jgi:hypothetical protein